MKSGFWGLLFVFLGIFGIIMIYFFGNLTINSEENYYLLKEISKSAMKDSIDQLAHLEGIGYDGIVAEPLGAVVEDKRMFCNEGEKRYPRIRREKFVENFLRKFAQDARLNMDYEIIFHEIIECPPKVSITINTKEKLTIFNFLGRSQNDKVDYNKSTTNMSNTLTTIIETYYDNENMITCPGNQVYNGTECIDL